MSSITIRIPDPLRRQLEKLSRSRQQPLSDMVRESLKRYVAVEKLNEIRDMTRPNAEARGFITDEDVFKAVS